MIKNALIILCLFLSACASTQTKLTTTPNVIINYECDVSPEDQLSLYNTILNEATCPQNITITITEYYKSDPLRQFIGWPCKGITIKSFVIVPSKSLVFNANSKVTNVGIINGGILLGIPGVLLGSANLARDVRDAESSLAKNIWKKTCK